MFWDSIPMIRICPNSVETPANEKAKIYAMNW
jgi:hypothetical protein